MDRKGAAPGHGGSRVAEDRPRLLTCGCRVCLKAEAWLASRHDQRAASKPEADAAGVFDWDRLVDGVKHAQSCKHERWVRIPPVDVLDGVQTPPFMVRLVAVKWIPKVEVHSVVPVDGTEKPHS